MPLLGIRDPLIWDLYEQRLVSGYELEGNYFKYQGQYRGDRKLISMKVECYDYRPLQVQLKKLPKIIFHTDNLGVGWNMHAHRDYFKDKNGKDVETVPLLMTTAHSHEEAYIQFKTMNRIKLTYSALGAKIFIIECQTDDYHPNDEGLRIRHPKLFRNDTFTFLASDDLIRSMPYKFVNGLKENVMTNLDKGWMGKLKKTLKQAETSTIKQIKLHRVIQPWDYFGNDCTEKRIFVYLVTTEDGIQSYATSDELQETLGCEEWFAGNMNCLSNIGSNLDIQLKLGATKKSHIESKQTVNCRFSVGNDVLVKNHGTKSNHRAIIHSIDQSCGKVTVKWESTGRKDAVNIGDLQMWSELFSKKRVSQQTDFLTPANKQPRTLMCKQNVGPLPGQFENGYFNEENTLKYCCEGAVRNLMSRINCSKDDTDLYWRIVTSPMQSVLDQLGEQTVPKSVLINGEVNSLELSLWILRKKFKFISTAPLKPKYFTKVNEAKDLLSKFKFPLLISASAINAVYKHVVVVWNGRIIDYESKYTYDLTNESLTQICGLNTVFHGIHMGYGLFPPSHIRDHPNNKCIQDWGMKDYQKDIGDIRKYFKLSL